METAIDLAFKMDSELDQDSPRTFAAKVAIEFAKLHVKAALEAATKSVKYNRPYIEVKDSILQAYPLENIK
jgi:hypothetical protein